MAKEGIPAASCKTPARKGWRRRWTIRLIVALALIAAFVVYFGRQTPIAVTLATGVGVQGLQKRVDALQAKARSGGEFTETDRRFLRDLYTAFAKGGTLTIVLRQSGTLMRHYLSCTGEPLPLKPRIFLNSREVQKEMTSLRTQLSDDARSPDGAKTEYRSSKFFMADGKNFDASVGLDYGWLVLRPSPDGHKLMWRAEQPWIWPAYAEGPAARTKFTIGNFRSVVAGTKYEFNIEDGLGEYLTHVGVAKSFVAYAEWSEDR